MEGLTPDGLVVEFILDALRYKEETEQVLGDTAEHLKEVGRAAEDAGKKIERDVTGAMKTLGLHARMVGQAINETFSIGLLEHFIGGVRILTGLFGTLASWVGRIKILLQSAANAFLGVVKAPFTIIQKLMAVTQNMLEKIFKSFEWFQYQLFMQFMNIWLLSKTVIPVISSFVDYNREIYNTWALIGDTWNKTFNEFISFVNRTDIQDFPDVFGQLHESAERLLTSGVIKDVGDLLHNMGLEMAETYGRMPKDIANAFYALASATVPLEDMFTATELAAKASIAGVTTIEKAVEAGVAATYAFGRSMSELNDIYDLQFTAIKYGIWRYEDLAKVMGRVYAPAASLSNTMENLQEVMATAAFATRMGLSPEMAAFGLARLYESLGRVQVIKNLEEIGVTVYDTMGRFVGLRQAVGDMVYAMRGFSVQTQQQMLSSIGLDMRAVRVLRSLINNYGQYIQLLDEFDQTVRGVDGSTSAMDQAFQRMTESFAFKMDQFTAAWERLKITLSESIIETLTYFMNQINSIMKIVSGIFTQGVIEIGRYSVAISDLVKHLTGLYAVFAILATLSGVVRAIIHPIGIFSAILAYLVKQAREGTEAFAQFADRFGTLGLIIQSVAQYFEMFTFLLSKGQTPLSAFGRLFSMFFEDLFTILGSQEQVANVVSMGSRLWESIVAIFNPAEATRIIADFVREFDKGLQREINILEVVGYRLGETFRAIGSLIKAMLASVLQLEDDSVENIVRELFTTIFRVVRNVFAAMLGIETRNLEGVGISEIVRALFSTLGLDMGVVRDAVAQIVRVLTHTILEAVKHLIKTPELILGFAGLNIAKTFLGALATGFAAIKPAMIATVMMPASKNIFAGMFSNIAGFFAIAGNVLKVRAIMEFIDMILPEGFLRNLSEPIRQAVLLAISAGVGVLITALQMWFLKSVIAGLSRTLGVGMAESITRAFRQMTVGKVVIYTPIVHIFTTGGIPHPGQQVLPGFGVGTIAGTSAVGMGRAAGFGGIGAIMATGVASSVALLGGWLMTRLRTTEGMVEETVKAVGEAISQIPVELGRTVPHTFERAMESARDVIAAKVLETTPEVSKLNKVLTTLANAAAITAAAFIAVKTASLGLVKGQIIRPTIPHAVAGFAGKAVAATDLGGLMYRYHAAFLEPQWFDTYLELRAAVIDIIEDEAIKELYEAAIYKTPRTLPEKLSEIPKVIVQQIDWSMEALVNYTDEEIDKLVDKYKGLHFVFTYPLGFLRPFVKKYLPDEPLSEEWFAKEYMQAQEELIDLILSDQQQELRWMLSLLYEYREDIADRVGSEFLDVFEEIEGGFAVRLSRLAELTEDIGLAAMFGEELMSELWIEYFNIFTPLAAARFPDLEWDYDLYKAFTRIPFKEYLDSLRVIFEDIQLIVDLETVIDITALDRLAYLISEKSLVIDESVYKDIINSLELIRDGQVDNVKMSVEQIEDTINMWFDAHKAFVDTERRTSITVKEQMKILDLQTRLFSTYIQPVLASMAGEQAIFIRSLEYSAEQYAAVTQTNAEQLIDLLELDTLVTEEIEDIGTAVLDRVQELRRIVMSAEGGDVKDAAGTLQVWLGTLTLWAATFGDASDYDDLLQIYSIIRPTLDYVSDKISLTALRLITLIREMYVPGLDIDGLERNIRELDASLRKLSTQTNENLMTAFDIAKLLSDHGDFINYWAKSLFDEFVAMRTTMTAITRKRTEDITGRYGRILDTEARILFPHTDFAQAIQDPVTIFFEYVARTELDTIDMLLEEMVTFEEVPKEVRDMMVGDFEAARQHLVDRLEYLKDTATTDSPAVMEAHIRNILGTYADEHGAYLYLFSEAFANVLDTAADADDMLVSLIDEISKLEMDQAAYLSDRLYYLVVDRFLGIEAFRELEEGAVKFGFIEAVYRQIRGLIEQEDMTSERLLKILEANFGMLQDEAQTFIKQRGEDFIRLIELLEDPTYVQILRMFVGDSEEILHYLQEVVMTEDYGLQSLEQFLSNVSDVFEQRLNRLKEIQDIGPVFDFQLQDYWFDLEDLGFDDLLAAYRMVPEWFQENLIQAGREAFEGQYTPEQLLPYIDWDLAEDIQVETVYQTILALGTEAASEVLQSIFEGLEDGAKAAIEVFYEVPSEALVQDQLRRAEEWLEEIDRAHPFAGFAEGIIEYVTETLEDVSWDELGAVAQATIVSLLEWLMDVIVGAAQEMRIDVAETTGFWEAAVDSFRQERREREIKAEYAANQLLFGLLFGGDLLQDTVISPTLRSARTLVDQLQRDYVDREADLIEDYAQLLIDIGLITEEDLKDSAAAAELLKQRLGERGLSDYFEQSLLLAEDYLYYLDTFVLERPKRFVEMTPREQFGRIVDIGRNLVQFSGHIVEKLTIESLNWLFGTEELTIDLLREGGRYLLRGLEDMSMEHEAYKQKYSTAISYMDWSPEAIGLEEVLITLREYLNENYINTMENEIENMEELFLDTYPEEWVRQVFGVPEMRAAVEPIGDTLTDIRTGVGFGIGAAAEVDVEAAVQLVEKSLDVMAMRADEFAKQRARFRDAFFDLFVGLGDNLSDMIGGLTETTDEMALGSRTLDLLVKSGASFIGNVLVKPIAILFGDLISNWLFDKMLGEYIIPYTAKVAVMVNDAMSSVVFSDEALDEGKRIFDESDIASLAVALTTDFVDGVVRLVKVISGNWKEGFSGILENLGEFGLDRWLSNTIAFISRVEERDVAAGQAVIESTIKALTWDLDEVIRQLDFLEEGVEGYSREQAALIEDYLRNVVGGFWTWVIMKLLDAEVIADWFRTISAWFDKETEAIIHGLEIGEITFDPDAVVMMAALAPVGFRENLDEHVQALSEQAQTVFRHTEALTMDALFRAFKDRERIDRSIAIQYAEREFAGLESQLKDLKIKDTELQDIGTLVGTVAFEEFRDFLGSQVEGIQDTTLRNIDLVLMWQRGVFEYSTSRLGEISEEALQALQQIPDFDTDIRTFDQFRKAIEDIGEIDNKVLEGLNQSAMRLARQTQHIAAMGIVDSMSDKQIGNLIYNVMKHAEDFSEWTELLNQYFEVAGSEIGVISDLRDSGFAVKAGADVAEFLGFIRTYATPEMIDVFENTIDEMYLAMLEMSNEIANSIWRYTEGIIRNISQTTRQLEEIGWIGEEVSAFVDALADLGLVLMDTRTHIQAIALGQQEIAEGEKLVGALGMASGIVGIIMSLVQVAVIIVQYLNRVNNLTEEQLVAIRSNTTAIRELSSILGDMRAVLYNPPAAFAYGYALAMDDARYSSTGFLNSTSDYRPGEVIEVRAAPQVTLNITINGTSAEDADVILEQIEDRVADAVRRAQYA